MKIITASIWITTHGAFPRKMEDLTGTMEEIVTRMRVYNPQIALMDARDMIHRAAFQTDHAWNPDRSIGIKVESVAASIDMMPSMFAPCMAGAPAC